MESPAGTPEVTKFDFAFLAVVCILLEHATSVFRSHILCGKRVDQAREPENASRGHH